jgi:hypothetical protein
MPTMTMRRRAKRTLSAHDAARQLILQTYPRHLSAMAI